MIVPQSICQTGITNRRHQRGIRRPGCVVAGAVVLLTFSVLAKAQSSSHNLAVDAEGLFPPAASVSPPAEDAAGRLSPMPESYTVRTAYPVGHVPRAARGSDESILVYKNALGSLVFHPGRGVLVADDLWTRLAAPCALDQVRIRVSGGVEGGGGEFIAELSLYDDCPDSNVGGALLPGTTTSFGPMDDDLAIFHDLTLDFSDRGICDDEGACEVSQQNCADGSLCVSDPLVIPSTVWLQLRFSTADAGVVVGTPATIGFSVDGYYDLFGNCYIFFGGWPTSPHASFWIEAYTAPHCELNPGILSYLANASSLTPYIPPNADGLRFADDIQVIADECEVQAIEIPFAGPSGSEVSVDVRLYDQASIFPRLPETSAVPGTAQVYTKTTSDVEVARLEFEPGIKLPKAFWVSWLPTSPNVGALPARVNLGAGDVGYATDSAGTGEWQHTSGLNDVPLGTFSIAVYCYDEVRGACCARQTCYDDVPLSFCAGARFADGVSCTPGLFDPPCDAAACCFPNALCRYLSLSECLNQQGQPRPGRLCDNLTPPCSNSNCGGPIRDCRSRRESPGCSLRSCCDPVCLYDPWCCESNWDEQCAEEAYLICGLPPVNESCMTAATVPANGWTLVDNREGSTDESTPAFPCGGDEGGPNGLGTVWYKFTATATSAHLSTCESVPPARDSLLEVFAADPADPCGTLASIGCNDDTAGCGAEGKNSSLCVENLTVGATYFVRAASKTLDDRGAYRLDIRSPCPPGTTESDNARHASAAVSQDDRQASIAVATGEAAGAPADGSGLVAHDVRNLHREIPGDPLLPAPRSPLRTPAFRHQGRWDRGTFTFVQVNVDEQGRNVVGDAGNEPSLAVSPVDPQEIVIGFRHFATIESNFRQAGMAYSHDAGQSWTFPGVLDPGIFRSDPVLAANADGTFFYYSLSLRGQVFTCDMFRSDNGGVTWDGPTYAFGGDKAWMAIDTTPGLGRNNIYATWSSHASCCAGHFTRSTTVGDSYETPIDIPEQPFWGTITVGLDGAVYVVGVSSQHRWSPVIRSIYLKDKRIGPVFDLVARVDLFGLPGPGAVITSGDSPNPDGLLGQDWIASDHSYGATRGNLYILTALASFDGVATDVSFMRSEDGGFTWSSPVRVNDDPADSNAWQWFGTMSVAPNGRIDAIWNDTRNTGAANLSEVFYSFSIDGGRTWSENASVTPVFDSWVGWPNQNKIGDYYHMVSDNAGANLAFAATFHNEQDVYFMRIEPDVDCHGNGVVDRDEIAAGAADCDGNLVPDTCEPDTDGDGLINGCDPDIDGDGVANDIDVCDATPLGAAVKPDGSRLGDFTSDCDIDLRDYRSFVTCADASGPNATGTPLECLPSFDYDTDEDVDLADLGNLQVTYTDLIRPGPQ